MNGSGPEPGPQWAPVVLHLQSLPCWLHFSASKVHLSHLRSGQMLGFLLSFVEVANNLILTYCCQVLPKPNVQNKPILQTDALQAEMR